MQVYISWSGQTSYRIALLLRNLLRKVIPGLEVWVSAEDIQDGSRWSSDLIQILNQVTFCIVCADPSNYFSPWFLFEFGAIAKAVDKYNIRILLHELTLSMLKGPFTMFSPLDVNKAAFTRLFEDLLANFSRIHLPRYEMIANLDEYWEDFDQDFAEINLVLKPEPLEIEQGGTVVEPPSMHLEHVNEIGQNMIALISVNEGIDDERIATTMYLNRSDTLRYLIDLENKGLVRSNLSFGIRRWFVTEIGRKYLPGVYQG